LHIEWIQVVTPLIEQEYDSPLRGAVTSAVFGNHGGRGGLA